MLQLQCRKKYSKSAIKQKFRYLNEKLLEVKYKVLTEKVLKQK